MHSLSLARAACKDISSPECPACCKVRSGSRGGDLWTAAAPISRSTAWLTDCKTYTLTPSHTCTHTGTHMSLHCIPGHIHTRTHTCTSHTQTYMHRMSTCTHILTHAHTTACTHSDGHILTHVCTVTQTHTQSHIHLHTDLMETTCLRACHPEASSRGSL